MLKRINKRHDFHGAVLVAKNKKIVYQNQVGYADFRKKTLINSEKSAGTHSVQWNGDNNYGAKVASGIYIYAVKANDFFQAKKMIMMKGACDEESNSKEAKSY